MIIFDFHNRHCPTVHCSVNVCSVYAVYAVCNIARANGSVFVTRNIKHSFQFAMKYRENNNKSRTDRDLAQFTIRSARSQ